MITLLATYSARAWSLWRSYRWQLFNRGIRIESRCQIGAGCTLKTVRGGTIRICERSELGTGVDLVIEGQLVIGQRVFVNRDSMILALTTIRIGARTLVGERVSIRDRDHRLSDTQLKIAKQGYEVAPISIGEDGWIGCNVVILKGVTIGQHTVVDPSSVVTRDLLSAFCVAAGVPARILRRLNPPANVSPS